MSKATIFAELDTQAEEIARSFNAKPKNGIGMITDLCAAQGIENSEEQIALFFHKHKANLDLEAVGAYLGGKENSSVLGYFTAQMDFAGKSYTGSMREYFSTFSLPGESQQIDRIMESFGNRFHEQNPGTFKSADTAFVLAFSTVMLGTDAHSTSIKQEKKMTREQFIKNNRGIDSGGDIDREVLDGIYTDIQATPLGTKFTETLPGITFEPTEKELEITLKTLKEKHVSNKFKEEQPRGIWGKLFGHKNTITIDGEDGAQVKIETYEPGWFSRNKATANIQPVVRSLGEDPQSLSAEKMEAALKLAGTIAANFPGPAKSLKATFSYQAEDMVKTYIGGLKEAGKKTIASVEEKRLTAGHSKGHTNKRL